MPTTRKRLARAPVEDLSQAQVCYLLDQPLPPLTPDDRWWAVVAATENRPHKAWYGGPDNCCSAIVLWARYRTELLSEWRPLHGRRRNPLEVGKQPPVALASLRAALNDGRVEEPMNAHSSGR
jgi:hypothetical protein